MKDVGLVGMPFSGRTTLFTALTRSGGAAGRDNQAVVPVPDPRLPVLAKLEGAGEMVPAKVSFTDVPGATTPRGLGALREADALSLVLRAFGPDPDPARELADLTAELILADIAVVESALDGARRRARGRGRDGAGQLEALERAHGSLSAEVLLRDAGLEDEARAHLHPLAPLTLKPWVVVANLEEGSGLPPELPPDAVGVWAGIEAETAEMPEEEARALLEEFGVPEPGLPRVVAASYRALDLVTFLTSNEQEARAWEVRRGATAPEAAGVIHTDFQRGFIRSEVIAFDDLVAAGGWHPAKARGLIRVEGKDYVVREGDVLNIRFAV